MARIAVDATVPAKLVRMLKICSRLEAMVAWSESEESERL
jgi:hypothetical protein